MAERTHHDATRPGEIEAPLPERTDARVVFIGTIRTPFLSRDECPRQGKAEGPLCRIELHDPWKPALKGIERFGRIEVLYWMHQARRDLILQSPKSNGETFGTFALRSPVRPNPIATSMVELVAIEDGVLVVRGLDCVDGTPLVDLKPDRCAYTPLAPPNPGELTEGSS
jgi:tRNA-Thr(GGU) m(6)t(6)A37 methyltransferase TsaA